MAAASDETPQGEWSTPLVSGKPPPARGGQSGVLISNLLVVFGGTYFHEKFQYLNDLWAVDTDSMEWHQPRAAGRAPMPRYGHAGAAVGTSIFYFGGKGSSKVVFNDLHRLDVERWSWSLVPSTTAPPAGRFGHSLVAVGDRLVLFGGWDGTTMLNDLWIFDVPASSWIKPVVEGPPPSPRHGHSMVLVPATAQLLVFGGWASDDRGHPDYRRDLRALDTATMTWQRTRETGERPDGRYGHSASMLNDTHMLVLGGWGFSQAAKSAAEEAAAATASSSSSSSTTSAGASGAASSTGGVITRRSQAAWVLDVVTGRWESPTLAGRAPGLRYGHSGVAIGPFALAFGGWDGVKSRSDIVQLDLRPLVTLPADEP